MNTPAKQNLRTTVDNVTIRADTQAIHRREALSLGSADPCGGCQMKFLSAAIGSDAVMSTC